jgi:hypothetical protein
MSEEDWRRLESLVRHYEHRAPTTARAYGMALAELLREIPPPADVPTPVDWMGWERRKTLRLLFSPRAR